MHRHNGPFGGNFVEDVPEKSLMLSSRRGLSEILGYICISVKFSKISSRSIMHSSGQTDVSTIVRMVGQETPMSVGHPPSFQEFFLST